MRDALEPLAKSFTRSLRAANKAPKTLEAYGAAVAQFIDFLEKPPPGDAAELLAEHPVADETDIRRAHIEAYIGHVLAHRKPSTAVNRYSGLQQWFRWMAKQPDLEIEVSPMASMERPFIPEADVPVVAIQHIKALIATCDVKTFIGLRDAAIISLFVDTGVRLSELAGLMKEEIVDGERVPSVNLDTNDVYVFGKGRRARTVSFGARTALAIDRYLRAGRRKHVLAYRPELWLPGHARHTSAISGSGIRQMIDRRADQAGVPHIHPHQFRHTWADAGKRADLSEEDIMRQGGWRSAASLRRYGAQVADARAREAHRRKSFMDQI
ncbi:MAG: tyrosine-type recombinase/integrase [Actinoallomurus sp.]